MDLGSTSTEKGINDWRGICLAILKSGWQLPLVSALLATVSLVHRQWPFPLPIFAATFLICLASSFLLRYYVSQNPVEGTPPVMVERILWCISLLGIAGVQIAAQAVGANQVDGVGFALIAPLVAQAMLASALLGSNLALYALTIGIFILGVGGAIPREILTTAWISGAVGVHAVNPMRQRSDLLRAVTIQALAQGVLAACATMMRVDSVTPVLNSAAWAALAAVIAVSIFWLAVTIFERIFGIISDWSLLELCSPEHPLIKELCLRAPGTYAHSVMVANLAEQAARAIGANPIHVRAMAYYHDIGKVERPMYFIENQIGENLHDDLPPTISSRIITGHVKDGLELAKRHRLPVIIQDGIAQHHGTSLVSYFYNLAMNLNGNLAPDGLDRLFRYDGPKPQNREVAILHLADQAEAASRSLRTTDPEDVEKLIDRLVENSRADGQLDESDLSFRDLSKVKKAFVLSLSALRHQRISYPESENGFPQAPNPSLQPVASEAPDPSHPNRLE